jgi:hypothetical protein
MSQKLFLTSVEKPNLLNPDPGLGFFEKPNPQLNIFTVGKFLFYFFSPNIGKLLLLGLHVDLTAKEKHPTLKRE